MFRNSPFNKSKKGCISNCSSWQTYLAVASCVCLTRTSLLLHWAWSRPHKLESDKTVRPRHSDKTFRVPSSDAPKIWYFLKQCQRSIRNFEFWLRNFSWKNSIWNLQTLEGAQINLAQFFSMYQFHTLQLPVGSKLELNNFVANRPRSSCWVKLAKFQLNFQRRLSPNQLLLILLFLPIASKRINYILKYK